MSDIGEEICLDAIALLKEENARLKQRCEKAEKALHDYDVSLFFLRCRCEEMRDAIKEWRDEGFIVLDGTDPLLSPICGSGCADKVKAALKQCVEALNEVSAYGNCDCDIPNGKTCITCQCSLALASAKEVLP